MIEGGVLKEMAKNASDLATGTRKNGNHKNGTARPGLRFGRYFTPEGSHAYDLIEWERRTAAIIGEKGQVIFEQKDVEVPRSWSQLAINVVAQKYFRGSPGSPERETSVRQIIDRVVETLAKWGRDGSYFATEEDAENWPRGCATSWSPSTHRSTARSGSTSASPTARSRARPASSTRSRTPWSRSSSWSRPRACCSSSAAAPAPTCQCCGPRKSSSPAAAPPPARSPS